MQKSSKILANGKSNSIPQIALHQSILILIIFGATLLKMNKSDLKPQRGEETTRCWGTLSGSDGRTIEFTILQEQNLHEGSFSSIGMVDSTATYSGKIYCKEDVFDTTTLRLERFQCEADATQGDHLVDEPTTLTLPYQGQRYGSGDFTIELEGPLSRVATSNPKLQVR